MGGGDGVELKRRTDNFILRLVGMTPTEMVESRGARDVTGFLFLSVTGKLLQTGVAVLLMKVLSLRGFGLYALVMSWTMVLIVPSLVGTPQFVQREIAVARSRAQWGRARGLFHWSTFTVLIVSSVIFIMASGRVFMTLLSTNADRYAFLVGFILIPLMALLQLWSVQLRAWGAILPGQMPDLIICPLLFGLLLLVMGTLLATIRMGAPVALGVNCGASLIALGMAAFLKFHYVRIEKIEPAKTETQKWLGQSSRFTLLSGLAIINYRIGILMVGGILGKADTGLFMVAV